MFIALIELWQVRHTFRPLSQIKMTDYLWSTFKAFLSFFFLSVNPLSVKEAAVFKMWSYKPKQSKKGKV